MPQPTFAMCCLCLTILTFGMEAACAPPPADEPLDKLAVLDRLVGSWVFRPDSQDFSARQECKWILNKQFLEIDTHVICAGQPPSSWRTLISYDQTSHCYRQWKFSDKGVVSTEHGTWNEDASELNLSGRTPSGNDSISSIKIYDDNEISFDVREFVDEKHTKLNSVMFHLSRVTPTKDHQLTK